VLKTVISSAPTDFGRKLVGGRTNARRLDILSIDNTVGALAVKRERAAERII
jgi:hypothetical protein